MHHSSRNLMQTAASSSNGAGRIDGRKRHRPARDQRASARNGGAAYNGCPALNPPRNVKTSRARKKGFTLGRLVLWALMLPVVGAACAALSLAVLIVLANDRLPSLEPMVNYQPRMPMQVYSVDEVLLAEFGEERRTFVKFENVPDAMKFAVLAAEDARFFEHSGVDIVGVGRAALANLLAGGTEQGASTITMQIAREFFLSNERTYPRKIAEILLALRIEQTLSKERIFELYLNQIFLGKRAYGFESAARTYFGKSLQQISVAEAALLAGLPKAPSRYNPFVNPVRATQRQRYVLLRMRENGFIDEPTYQAALAEPMKFAAETERNDDIAPYAAELARRLVFGLYQDAAYSAGLRVYTTIHSRDQLAANKAVHDGVIGYDARYGYRGPERTIELPADPQRAAEVIADALARAGSVEGLQPAIVTAVDKQSVTVVHPGGTLVLKADGIKLVADHLSSKADPATRVAPGALVRVVEFDGKWKITQVPEVQAAFVAVNTHDGSIRALVGGFDFEHNQFDRATQAYRQPGSSFKPFIYSAALERGITTTTVVNDAPISLLEDDPREPTLWEPKNFDGRFDGPMTLRTALARSKNLVSIRVMQHIGAPYARDYVSRFGFEPGRQPAVLTLGLGAGLVTPLQLATGISVFANGGYRIDPYLISHITDAQGNKIAQAAPAQSGDENNRVVDARNAYIMDSMLRDVVRRGTATRARALNRPDLAGKTGTTNDSHDAWFVGYQPTIAAAAWVGFDQPRNLGNRETGGGLALPIWIDYMKTALEGVPTAHLEPPQGLVRVAGDIYLDETTPDRSVRAIGMGEGGIATGQPEKEAEKLRDEVF